MTNLGPLAEFGRRARLKIECPKGRTGSSPVGATENILPTKGKDMREFLAVLLYGFGMALIVSPIMLGPSFLISILLIIVGIVICAIGCGVSESVLRKGFSFERIDT